VETKLDLPLCSDIHVVDDFLEDSTFLNLSSSLADSAWSYGWRSSKGRNYGIWHTHIVGGDKDCRIACDHELKQDQERQLYSTIWQELTRSHLNECSLLRAYANAQTYGLDGGVHTDNKAPHECMTAIIYGHPYWAFPWGGELVFYTALGEVMYSVSPSPNRLVIFDSAIPHMARAPHRECPALRVSLVYKALRRTAKP
jgi:SM-20-related protein